MTTNYVGIFHEDIVGIFVGYLEFGDLFNNFAITCKLANKISWNNLNYRKVGEYIDSDTLLPKHVGFLKIIDRIDNIPTGKYDLYGEIFMSYLLHVGFPNIMKLIDCLKKSKSLNFMYNIMIKIQHPGAGIFGKKFCNSVGFFGHKLILEEENSLEDIITISKLCLEKNGNFVYQTLCLKPSLVGTITHMFKVSNDIKFGRILKLYVIKYENLILTDCVNIEEF